MKKKLIRIFIVVAIAVLLVIYFYPKPLSDVIIPDSTISINDLTFNYENSLCETSSLKKYEFLPKTGSYNELLSILEKYSYHKNLRTFSDVGLNELSCYQISSTKDIYGGLIELGKPREICINQSSYNIGFWGNSKATLLVNEINEFLKTQTPIFESE